MMAIRARRRSNGRLLGVVVCLALLAAGLWWWGDSPRREPGGSSRTTEAVGPESPGQAAASEKIESKSQVEGDAMADSSAATGTQRTPGPPAPDHGRQPIVRIHGRLVSELGRAIPNGAVELEFSDREMPLRTTTTADGAYEFLFEDPTVVAQRSPTGLRASATGFVLETLSLWTDQSGYRIEGNVRHVDIEMSLAQEVLLTCMFDDGTPVGDASVNLIPATGLEDWLLDAEPYAAGRTDSDGIVRFPDMPMLGVYHAIVGLDGIQKWFEVPVDLRSGQLRDLVVPAPCTLHIELSTACLEPGDEGCSPTHIRLLVSGGSPGDLYDATRYYRIAGGECTVPGLRLGDTVELRLLCRRGAYHLLAEDLHIADRVQTRAFDCLELPLVSESVLPVAGVQHPLIFQWRLTDAAGVPITLSRLGALDVDGLRCTWHAGQHDGEFTLYNEGSNSFQVVHGYVELAIEPPVTVRIAGFGIHQEVVVSKELQAVDLAIDIDALSVSLARLHFEGLSWRNERATVAAIELTHVETGHAYRARRRTRKRSTPLEVSLPIGTYQYKAASMTHGTSPVAPWSGALDIQCQFSGVR